MATYKAIQNYIKDKYNCSVKTCWIADMKEQCGISTRKAPNRISESKRVYPCPIDHKLKIEDAFRYFKML
ncbi:MAG: hypothetical protein RBR50_04025 [Candidatus Izemoplasmatales bacterium]|nr:hypothetical protein [Candidatus Izemoplasmatales bacterium]